MKLQTKSLLTAATACAAIAAGSSNNAASAGIVTDDVPTDTSAAIDRTLAEGVTVTSANLVLIKPGGGDPEYVDSTQSPWNGNLYTYRLDDINTNADGGGLGNVTYEAAAGSYFQDFDARIIVNAGAIGRTTAGALDQFTFEGSTDGLNFSTIVVTGTFVDMQKDTNTEAENDSYDNWVRYSVVPTEALGQLTSLRIGMNVKASGGLNWHQQFGAVSLDVVPEPGSLALLGLGGLLVARRRRA